MGRTYIGAFPDVVCPDLCSFLVGSAAGQVTAQTGDACFTKRPNVLGLKLRDQAKEQSNLVELYQEGWLKLLEFAVPEPMPWTETDHHSSPGWRHRNIYYWTLSINERQEKPAWGLAVASLLQLQGGTSSERNVLVIFEWSVLSSLYSEVVETSNQPNSHSKQPGFLAWLTSPPRLTGLSLSSYTSCESCSCHVHPGIWFWGS